MTNCWSSLLYRWVLVCECAWESVCVREWESVCVRERVGVTRCLMEWRRQTPCLGGWSYSLNTQTTWLQALHQKPVHLVWNQMEGNAAGCDVSALLVTCAVTPHWLFPSHIPHDSHVSPPGGVCAACCISTTDWASLLQRRDLWCRWWEAAHSWPISSCHHHHRDDCSKESWCDTPHMQVLGSGLVHRERGGHKDRILRLLQVLKVDYKRL